VEAAVEGSNSVPGLAALAVVVQFVNDRAPTVTVDTLTDSGQAEVRADAPAGTFIAHLSASDANRGVNGRVSCRLDSHGDDFRLVRMFDGEYKMLTERSFDVVGVVFVTVSCQDHGDPPLSTQTNISVTIRAALTASNPVFTQPVYNATLSLASQTPVFVIRVVAAAPNSPSNGAVYYSFAESYPAFTIGRTTGVVRMLVTPSETVTHKLVVTARTADGGFSTAIVHVSLERPEEVLFFKNTVFCRVKEDAELASSVCSLADTDAILVADECLYYDLVDTADGKFRADPINGVVYTNGTLDREQTRHFRLVVRVQLDMIPTRVVNVLLELDVEDVNDCAPQFIFPSPGNETVLVDATTERLSTSRLLRIALVRASDRDASENGRVTYSIVANNSDSQYFVVAPSTGEVSLNVVDRLDDLINRSFVLYIAATDQGRPPLQSVAVLRIVLPAGIPTSSKYSEPQSDSRLMVLAGVLSSFVIVVLVIVVAITIVCRKSKRRKPQSPITSDVFWRNVQSSSAEVNQSSSSTPAISAQPASNDVDRTLHLSTLTVDAGVDYIQRYKVCIQYPQLSK